MSKHHLTATVAAAAILAASVGMASAEVVINRGNDTDPATLDQHKTSTVSESRVLKDLYDGLVVQDAKAQIVPGAAESWEISEDGLTYTFKLRPDGKWSNGEPVTAQDFEFSFRRIMTPETAAGYASVLFDIANAEEVTKGEKKPEELGVRAIDDHTFEITLKQPTPYFLELLTHQSSLPLNKASVEKFGDQFTRAGNLVTNGAYTLESFTPNDKIVMKKNPNYYDAAEVKIDTVNWVPFEDRSSCMRRFEAKEIQICSDVAAEQMDYVKANLSGQFKLAPYLGTYYLPVKGADGSPLKDPRVRRALSLVIDREFLSEQVWRGTMMPGYSLVPPGISNYVENPPMLDFKDKDILDREDEAKKLLEEAGVAPGSLTVQLNYNTSEDHRNTMAAVADQLGAIGVKATLNEMEGSSYFKYMQDDGAFDLARAGWIGDYNDPQNFLYLAQSGVSFNYAHWSNPDYDALMNKAAGTLDMAERAAILAEAEKLFLEQEPFIPVLYYSSRALVADNVKGYEDNIMDVHRTRYMSIE